MIGRREVITLLGGAGLLCAVKPKGARAQQPTMPVVGYLSNGSPGANAHLLAAFRQGLDELGYVEERNFRIEFRWSQGQYNRLPALADDLVRHSVAVIVTTGSVVAARAAKEATVTIPIVFGVGSDPVQAGLVASLNRPGGNATGFAELNTDTASKRLGLLHDLMPGALRFALLIERDSAGGSIVTGLEAGASAIGVQIEPLVANGSNSGIDEAFTTLVQKKVDALMVSPGPLFYARRAQIAALATRHAIPVIYWDRALVEAGGLMSYGSSVANMFRQVGIYTGRILKGGKPADLPVMQATKFELVINLRAAKAIGLTIPETFLARADEVIE